MSQPFGFSTTAADVVARFPERVHGRNFLVTGPSPGSIGAETVLALAHGHPRTLLLVGRTPPKYAPVVAAIRAIDASIDVRVYGVDLASADSVRAGALQIERDAKADSESGGFGCIDVLVNNAGVSDGSAGLKKSTDGVEMHFATNQLGPWLLTNMLMDLLKRSEEPRVVNLTSGAHRVGLGVGDYSDINFEKRDYTWFQAYAESKVATFHFTRYLTKCDSLMARNLTAFTVHPGLIWNTELTRTVSSEEMTKLKAYVAGTGVQEKTPQQGAATTLVAALDPALVELNGAFLFDCAVSEPFCDDAKREDLEDPLWRLCETLAGETFAH
ncbi:NAD(P)-binding protein [Auriculariales sp. MPI-PUGE-AT-0066]|nr:NAD(P)-binding protein [Auriculariales sp. MPI-PUGE-AT-0066]